MVSLPNVQNKKILHDFIQILLIIRHNDDRPTNRMLSKNSKSTLAIEPKFGQPDRSYLVIVYPHFYSNQARGSGSK